MNCPKCMQPFEGTVCPSCQTPVASQIDGDVPYATSVGQTSQQNNSVPPHLDSHQQGDGTGGVIPYKNPKALIAYYLGILSGLPLIGLPLGVAAFVLGILGLKARKRNPVVKGSVHAWVGIGCGGLFAVLWGLLAIVIIIQLLVG